MIPSVLVTVGWTRLVAIYIAVSNVHHCAFANIKFHLPLVGQIFQLVDVFLKLYYVIGEYLYFADHVVIQVIDVYVES